VRYGFGVEGTNPLVAVILGRRSWRTGFSTDPVPDAVIEVLVRCGNSAPSSKNAKPWRLHPVTDPSLLAAVADRMEMADARDRFVPSDPETGEPRPDYVSTVVESAGALREVPLAIFIENSGAFSGGRRNVASASRENLEDALVGYSLEILGVGAAIENLLIAAEGLGMRAVFIGDILIAEEAIKSLVHIGSDLVGVVAVGYPSVDGDVDAS